MKSPQLRCSSIDELIVDNLFCQLFRSLDNDITTVIGIFRVILIKINFNPVWLRNRLISSRLETVLSHTENSCIVSYYSQFYTNIKLKIVILIPVLLGQAFGPSYDFSF